VDVGEHAMAFDVDVEWKSDVRAKMDVVGRCTLTPPDP
jgi:hypothetical protein